MWRNLVVNIFKPMVWYDTIEEPFRFMMMLVVVAPLILFTALFHFPKNLIPLAIMYVILMYRVVYLFIIHDIKDLFKGD